MRQTSNLGLALYDSEDKMNITGAENSLNHNMELIDEAIHNIPAGEPGQTGNDGITPHIGENGHWWIGEEDTGVTAEGQDGQDGTPGTDGKSAYSYAHDGGYTGTEEEFAKKLAAEIECTEEQIANAVNKYLEEHSTGITSEMAKALYIVLKDVAFDPNSPYEKDLKNFMSKWLLTDEDIEFAVAGYTRVKYIDNKARCMIDTGYTPNINTRCVLTFMLYDSDNNCNTIAGTANSTNGPAYVIGADPITTGGNVWGRINDSAVNLYTGGANLKSNRVYTYDFSKDAVTINDEQIPLNGTAANVTTLNNHLYLFIRKISSASSGDVHPPSGNSKHMAVYRFSIYENDELKMDLIPAIRDIDDKPGLYDVIGGTFLMNVGNKAYEFGYEKLDGTYIDPIV